MRVTKEQNAALVVVTHDESVARWCDRTVRVRDGRIVEETTAAQGTVANAGAGR